MASSCVSPDDSPWNRSETDKSADLSFSPATVIFDTIDDTFFSFTFV